MGLPNNPIKTNAQSTRYISAEEVYPAMVTYTAATMKHLKLTQLHSNF